MGLTLVIGVALAALMFAALEGLKRAGLMDETRLGDMASELKGDLVLTLARFALSLLVVGFVEELLFRGFVMDRIAKALGGSVAGSALAVPGQAVLFGLSHAYQGMQSMMFTAGVGLVFGIIVVAARRNLWPVIVAHSIFDAGRAAYLYFLLTRSA